VTTTTEDVLRRYPRLVAHLICESLGYFSPDAPANAIVHGKRGERFACEWYVHMAGADRSLVEIGLRGHQLCDVGSRRERVFWLSRTDSTQHSVRAGGDGLPDVNAARSGPNLTSIPQVSGTRPPCDRWGCSALPTGPGMRSGRARNRRR
jgi:hypothetical protein